MVKKTIKLTRRQAEELFAKRSKASRKGWKTRRSNYKNS